MTIINVECPECGHIFEWEFDIEPPEERMFNEGYL
jgi:hypothetical protein